MRRFADDNFNFAENGRKIFKRVEKVVGKGDIALFSFSLGVFKSLILQTRKNQGLFGKGLTLYHAILDFYDPKKEAFWNIVGKEYNAGKPAFSFSIMFSTLSKSNLNLIISFILIYANAFNLDWSKMLLFG